MARHRYSSAGGGRADRTVTRVLDAAEELVRAGQFHTATMDTLAEHAGVSRATLFARFGSRLGVLESLNVRCAGSPEIAALEAALAVDDPVEQLDALIDASCGVWEHWGDVQRHLRAIVVLEPDVRPLIEEQRQFQRTSLHTLAKRLGQRGLLADGVSPARAAVALHTLTGLEAFVELRLEGKLSFNETIETIRRLARSLTTTR